MKTRNYLFIKSGEAVFVFTILLLCLAFKSHGQVQTEDSTMTKKIEIKR